MTEGARLPRDVASPDSRPRHNAITAYERHGRQCFGERESPAAHRVPDANPSAFSSPMSVGGKGVEPAEDAQRHQLRPSSRRCRAARRSAASVVRGRCAAVQRQAGDDGARERLQRADALAHDAQLADRVPVSRRRGSRRRGKQRRSAGQGVSTAAPKRSTRRQRQRACGRDRHLLAEHDARRRLEAVEAARQAQAGATSRTPDGARASVGQHRGHGRGVGVEVERVACRLRRAGRRARRDCRRRAIRHFVAFRRGTRSRSIRAPGQAPTAPAGAARPASSDGGATARDQVRRRIVRPFDLFDAGERALLTRTPACCRRHTGGGIRAAPACGRAPAWSEPRPRDGAACRARPRRRSRSCVGFSRTCSAKTALKRRRLSKPQASATWVTGRSVSRSATAWPAAGAASSGSRSG